MQRYFAHTLLLAGLILLLGSCQSPVKVPEEVPTTVRVIVQDDQAQPISAIPVELHEGIDPAANAPLQSLVTDNSGLAVFNLDIPSDGERYSLLVGSDQTGRVTRTLDLLCRDTTIVVVLASQNIPCGAEVSDTVQFVDVCAPRNGVEFTELVERRYTSTCDEPMTLAISRAENPDLRLETFVFDNDGILISGNQFELPARGSFSVVTEYTPQDENTFQARTIVDGQGDNSSFSLSIDIFGNSVLCDDCQCEDETIIVDMGATVVDTAITIQDIYNVNRTPCLRTDELIQNFPAGSPFTLDTQPMTSIQPGNGQPLQVTFNPTQEGTFTETLVFRTTFPENGVTCTYTIEFTAVAGQPACCIELDAGRNITVDASTQPPTYRIELLTDVNGTDAGAICFYNCGTAGWLTISRPGVFNAPGFTIENQRYDLQPRSEGGGLGCFDVSFTPTEDMVWPNGRNAGPAVVEFRTTFNIIGCQPQQIEVIARVDTTPTLFSRCVFRWEDNQFNGYNFTPVENKGSDIVDMNADDIASPMLSDLVYLSGPGTGLTGRVRIRSGWKFVRSGVTSINDFGYEDIRNWPEFPNLKNGIDRNSPFTDFELFSVYVIEVERDGSLFYALIRVREISDDGEKQKICFDVLFPL
ncbi:MAG: hypothetical protein CL946_03135 [Ectothiorhodospiraceae bacterium]|nr:hypothetical protein [Ectothiorhodospiraceae bacterium]